MASKHFSQAELRLMLEYYHRDGVVVLMFDKLPKPGVKGLKLYSSALTHSGLRQMRDLREQIEVALSRGDVNLRRTNEKG